MYIAEWSGSADPEDSTGTATFMVESEKFVLELVSFERFRAVCRMLDLAHQQGKTWAAQDLDYVVRSALRERVFQICAANRTEA